MSAKIVAGNWKMNKDFQEAQELTSEVVNMVKDETPADVTVILCPPAVHLSTVAGLVKDATNIFTGAQNCSEQESGAFTGEISAAMIKSVGVDYVVLGHSERREYFGESDELIAKKIDKVLEHGLKPIYCCGEALEVREAGTHVEYVKNQISASLFHLGEDQLKQVVIAYEPIWAIGTGKTASDEQAQEMHAELRAHLAWKYGKEVAAEISILYGGSCKPANAKGIFAGTDVDGGLIGGASLKSRDFVDITKSY